MNRLTEHEKKASPIGDENPLSARNFPLTPKQNAFRNWIEFRRNHLKFLLRAAREWGDFSCFKIGPQTVFLINDPELIKEMLVSRHDDFVRGPGHQAMKKIVLGNGLLTSDGSFHHRQRRLMQPAFQKKRITSYGRIMTEYTKRAMMGWQEGAEIDIAQEMMHLSLTILTKTLLDADIEEDAKSIGEDVHMVLKGSFKLLDSPLAFLATKFSMPIPRSLRLRRAQIRLDKVIYKMIEERRRTNEDRGDFLSMLLMAQDQEDHNKRMTDRQVRDEAMTILVAGQETIALALTWTWYLLSQHPDIRTKLQQEVDSILEGRDPTIDDLTRLNYTRQVFAEAMRLYPPVWAVGRIAMKNLEIGGYSIPKGALVMVSPFVTHHDARHFANPETFNPDRWSGEEQANRHKLAYFPFLLGPNRCIGEHFAWIEGTLVLATIAQQWIFELAPNFRVELMPLVTLRPRNGMRMIARQRKVTH